MTSDNKSLSDEATYAGTAKHPPKQQQSLGDRATLGGGDGSSVSDLGNFGDLPDHDMEIVDLSGRYKIEETLGQGGMGEVLLATDTRLDRKVAIKRIRGDAGASKAAVARFLTEAKSVAALNHPNVVQIHDYGRDESGPFLIMEYVAGGSLLDRCKQGPMELEEAVELACQLCDGLGRAHEAGIIHRDIKPANILLTADGIPKLTDFGLAKADSRDHTMTMAGAVLGTLDFMPPEQRQDASLVDHRSDLWSLGATLYQMVTGKSPKVIRLHEVPQSLQVVFAKALEESKEDRYQTAAEMGTALQDAKRGQAISTADLDEGQCPSCGAKNPSSRKFCKECAASLVIGCFQCESSIPVWEKICGECGCVQEEILGQRRETMQARQVEAEDALKDLNLDLARQIVTEIQNEPDTRLGEFKEWSTKFREEIETVRQREHNRAGDLLSEAIKHEEAKDFQAGIRTLEQVPQPIRDVSLPSHSETIASALGRLIDKQTQCNELENSIRSRVKSRQLDGLLETVEQLLQLLPDRSDIRTLHGQLSKRHQKQVEQVDAIVVKARQLRSQCKFAEAVDTLNRIPECLRDVTVVSLAEEYATLGDKRDQAINALNSSVKTNAFANALRDASFYQSVLEKETGLVDEEFSTLYRQTQVSHERQRKEEDKENRKKAQLRKIWFGVAAGVATIALLLLGMWGLSVQRANALASALESQRWDEVLMMDPDNVRALVGRANDAIVSASPDLDWVLAEVEQIESLDLSNPTANEIKGKVYALQSVQASESGDVNTGQTKLREAERLKVDSAYADRASKALAQAYVERAASSVTSGNLPQAIADAKRAMALDSNIALPESIAVAIAESNATDLANAYEQNPSAEALDAVVSALDGLESLDSQSSVLESLRMRMQAMALAMAESTAADLVDAYERSPTNGSLSAAASALNTASDLASNPNEASLVSLRNRLASVLLQSITVFESTRSDTDLQAALASARQLETELQDQTFASGANSRIATALVARFGEISLDQALREISLLDTLNADSATRQAANRVIGSSLVRRFRDSLGKGDYAIAADDYSAIASLDTDAAKQISGDWLKIPEQDYDQIPTPALANLPASALANLPASVIAKLPARTNSIGMKLKLIPPGTFLMGSESGDSDEKPIHQVTLTKPYELGVYEVTQEQYERVMGTNPSEFKGSTNPVEQVSWDTAVEFCEKLSSLPSERAAGRVYRLPTEAEWEYACGAGTTTAYSFGDDAGSLGEYAWYSSNSDKKTHPAGEKLANPRGLYDMNGNVWEWCSDWHGTYPSGSVTDPTGPRAGSSRVLRGGCWDYPARFCRSAYRSWDFPSRRRHSYGFRVTCVPSGQ